MNLFQIVLATAEESEPVDSSVGLGIGAIALLIAVALLLAWMGFLFVNSRRSRAAANEAAPPNLSPHVSDEELENTKLTKVLRASLFGAALLAIVLPWYAFNEPGRQADFAEELAAFDIEEGAHWFSPEGFACADCHGPTAGGGAAEYNEARSGVLVNWAVPSLDDVLYRYDAEEVRYWITYGRANTPMPANGLEGGGAMSVQEIDQTIDFLESIQISQSAAFDKALPSAEAALARIDNAPIATQSLINRQSAEIVGVEEAESKYDVVRDFPDDIKDLFQAPGTCTERSAALVGATCDDPGVDTDRDGLTDETEIELSNIAGISMITITALVSDTTVQPNTYSWDPNPLYDVRFDPENAFTNETTLGPEPDLVAADTMLSELEASTLLLSVTAERAELFLEGLIPGREFLETALEDEPWAVDFDAVAEAMDVSSDDAELAVGLFNAYCARCHTGGYSAGAAFEQGAGSGAWAPALMDGRAKVQFPDIADQIAFIITGSNNAEPYGVNGIGTGRMPGFGMVLSQDQIELIVAYERSL